MTRAKRPGSRQVGVLFLIVFIDLVGFGMVIPILPLYAEKYDPPGWLFGLFMASFSAMQFIFSPLLGALSDRVGRRPVLVISMLGAAAGYALLAMADSMLLLFASRIVAGVCGANIATAQAVIADLTGPEGRTRAMGIIGAAFGLGFIFGPALGGLLVHYGEAWPGVAASLASLTAAILVLVLLPETRFLRTGSTLPRRRLDWAVLTQVLRDPLLGICLVLILLVITAFSAFETTFAQFLLAVYGLEPREIAFLFVYAGVLAAIVQGGLVGRLSRRFGEARLITFGVVLAAISLGLLPLVKAFPLLLAVLAGLALGIGLTTPSLASLTSQLAPDEQVGRVMGQYQSLSSLGRIVGPFAAEIAFASSIGLPSFGGSALLVVGAALALLLAVRLRRAGRLTPVGGAG
ncbi:MAG: MFS transporter [Acidobacteriota bacterium]|nr:MFS transporter [Acidobacteriota bacterium]MDQ7087912.1 MFS transporter [Acidobacteriota bacterium]